MWNGRKNELYSVRNRKNLIKNECLIGFAQCLIYAKGKTEKILKKSVDRVRKTVIL